MTEESKMVHPGDLANADAATVSPVSDSSPAGQEGITLKWGTLKGWSIKTEATRAALQAYMDAGPVCYSAMAQRDTPEQKQALCNAIDVVDGEIWNDWDGVAMTKDEAKAYVMNYGKPRSAAPSSAEQTDNSAPGMNPNQLATHP